MAPIVVVTLVVVAMFEMVIKYVIVEGEIDVVAIEVVKLVFVAMVEVLKKFYHFSIINNN